MTVLGGATRCLLVVGVIFLLEGCLVLSRIVSWGCVHTWLRCGTGFSMEPEVFFVVDWGVSVVTKMGDARLSTGNGGTKEKVSRSESEVVLVIAGEGEAEGCCGAVCRKVHMMDKTTVRFFVLTVKVGCGVGEAHGMT